MLKELKSILVPLASIGGIVLIELHALDKGINGVAMSSSLILIAGIGGFYVRDLLGLFRKG